MSLPVTSSSHQTESASGGFFSRFPLQFVRNRKGYHWYVVGTVCVGAFMAALDASIINIALPKMRFAFHVSMGGVEWVSLAYLLTLAALIVPLGRLADMLGRRWMYAIGFTVFIIGSLLCGLSSTITFLIIARILQAFGAAMLQANSVAIITAATPIRDRGKAIGIQASAQGVGLSLGPAIGGALVQFLGWRWIFYVNIPVGIIGTLLGILLLPADKKHEGKKEPFDVLGAILLAPTLVAAMYVLKEGSTQGWGSGVMLAAYAVAVVGLILFLLREQKTKYPMLDLHLFRIPIFALGNVTGILSFAVMYAVTLLGPFFLSDVNHLSFFQAGLFMMVVPIGMTVFTPLSGALADKFGPRSLTIIGMLVAGAGALCLTFMGGHGTYVFLVTGLLLVGSGLGLFTPPNNSSVMNAAPSNRLGVAGGILNMSRTLGMGLGVTLGGVSYQIFLRMAGSSETVIPAHAQMVEAFRGSFIVVLCIAAIAMLISATKRLKTPTAGTEV